MCNSGINLILVTNFKKGKITMSTQTVIKNTRLTNTEQQIIDSPEMTGVPLSELEVLKQKLAQAEAALAKAAAPKQKAFSSVSYLFSLLPEYVNKDGLLPVLDKLTAELLQKKVQDKQKELGIEKCYKIISVYTDYRFFSMTLSAIATRFYLNVKTGKES